MSNMMMAPQPQYSYANNGFFGQGQMASNTHPTPYGYPQHAIQMGNTMPPMTGMPPQIFMIDTLRQPLGRPIKQTRGRRLNNIYLTKNHRRDLIWRPLLRMFRRFLKKDALSIDAYERIRGKPLVRQG